MKHDKVTTSHIRAVTGTTFVSTLSWLLGGYYTASITGVVAALHHHFIAPLGLTETAANLLLGFAVCSSLLGTIFGALLAGHCDRKSALTVLLEQTERQKKATIHEPDAGWSRASYERELDAYIQARGRAPQTITMHPDTMDALGFSGLGGGLTGVAGTPILVTSCDYDRATITLYY